MNQYASIFLLNMTLLSTSQSVMALETNPVSQVSSTANVTQEKSEVRFEEGELEQLLAPIALYPDTLLSHVLIASTYPLEVVQAYRFRQLNEQLAAEEIQQKAEDKDWDPSVVALLPFKTVLKQLHDDLNWTQEIGDAFLVAEQQVMTSIQSLRKQAEQAGNLQAMDNMEVKYEQQKIIIEPAQPEVIYVPYYDTRIVYGHWPWHYYPPVHWQHVGHHYSHYNPYYWGTGVHISVGFYFSTFHWHNHYVSVNYAHHRHYRHHYSHHDHYKYRGKRHHVVKSGYAKQWRHNPYHRKNVVYKSKVHKSAHVSGYSKKGSVKHFNKKRVLDESKYLASNKGTKQFSKNNSVKVLTRGDKIDGVDKYSTTYQQLKHTRTKSVNTNSQSMKTRSNSHYNKATPVKPRGNNSYSKAKQINQPKKSVNYQSQSKVVSNKKSYSTVKNHRPKNTEVNSVKSNKSYSKSGKSNRSNYSKSRSSGSAYKAKSPSQSRKKN